MVPKHRELSRPQTRNRPGLPRPNIRGKYGLLIQSPAENILRSTDRLRSLRFLLLLFLQNNIDRLNDAFILVSFAVDDHVMNSALDPRHVYCVFLGQPIIPTTVPDTEEVCVFLIGVCELTARQFLDIDVAICVCVFRQLNLRRCRRNRYEKTRKSEQRPFALSSVRLLEFIYWISLTVALHPVICGSSCSSKRALNVALARSQTSATHSTL
jgi:hypothetical protein